MRASRASVRMSSETIGVGRHNRLPGGERLEGGQRCALPERREHAQIERAENGGHIFREPDEHESVAQAQLARLRFERFSQRALADEEETGAWLLLDDQVSGLDQVRVSLGLVQPRHCPDGEVIRADLKVLPGGRDFVGRARAAELIVRRAQVHDFHLGRLDEPCMDDEFGGALRDRDGDIGVALESAIGDLLKPGRVGQVRVLVQDRGDTAHGRRQSSERRRAVAVEVKDVDLFLVDDLQQCRERRRIELAFVQIRDVDAEGVERFLRQVLLAQADERDVEAGGIEPGNHPGEQTLHAVHARAFPAEMIADLEHANHARVPTIRAGTPTAVARSGTASRTTAPAPITACAPMMTPSRTLTPAPSQAPSPTLMPADVRG